MNRLKAWIRNTFGFSRTETNAFLILLPAMALLIFSEPIYRLYLVNRPQDYSEDKNRLDSLTALWEYKKKDEAEINSPSPKFQFDPNVATEDDFFALGFPGNLTQRILNYRAKKGKFIVKADLKKMYGMDSSFYAELVPFIKLPDKRTIFIKEENTKIERVKKPEVALFDLNLADTSQLSTIYGIGSVLSSRIVEHRQKLGGFISYQQLEEIYALDTVVINRLARRAFIQTDFKPTQININEADEKTLATHPYIKFKLAKAIVTYRFQHGRFQSMDALKSIHSMKPETIEKLKPYLAF